MALWRSPKPVVAQVHGCCVGGGTDFALCSDLIIVRRGLPHRLSARARLGLADDGDVDLPHRPGARQAPAAHRRLADGRTAAEWGLACKAVPRGRAGRAPARARAAGRTTARESAAHDEAARQPGVRADGPRHDPAHRHPARRRRPPHARGRRLHPARDGGRARARSPSATGPFGDYGQGPRTASSVPSAARRHARRRRRAPHRRREGAGRARRPPADPLPRRRAARRARRGRRGVQGVDAAADARRAWRASGASPRSRATRSPAWSARCAEAGEPLRARSARATCRSSPQTSCARCSRSAPARGRGPCGRRRLEPLLALLSRPPRCRCSRRWSQAEPATAVVERLDPLVVAIDDEDVFFNVNEPEDVLRRRRCGAARPPLPERERVGRDAGAEAQRDQVRAGARQRRDRVEPLACRRRPS